MLAVYSLCRADLRLFFPTAAAYPSPTLRAFATGVVPSVGVRRRRRETLHFGRGATRARGRDGTNGSTQPPALARGQRSLSRLRPRGNDVTAPTPSDPPCSQKTSFPKPPGPNPAAPAPTGRPSSRALRGKNDSPCLRSGAQTDPKP